MRAEHFQQPRLDQWHVDHAARSQAQTDIGRLEIYRLEQSANHLQPLRQFRADNFFELIPRQNVVKVGIHLLRSEVVRYIDLRLALGRQVDLSPLRTGQETLLGIDRNVNTAQLSMFHAVTEHHFVHDRLIDDITAQMTATVVGDLYEVAIDQPT